MTKLIQSNEKFPNKIIVLKGPMHDNLWGLRLFVREFL